MPQIFYCAVLQNAFPARQSQPFIALQINTRDAAAAWCAGMECEICVGEIANPAVCSKRATLLGNVDRANRKAAVRAELTKRLDVKSVGIRGGDHRNTTSEYWIDGRRIRPR